MSIDGSFSPSAALRRFLARCPALAPHPRLASLSQTSALTSDDLVDAISDPFLHPSYTIPIVGCFRPLARRIAQRAVARLRFVPGLAAPDRTASVDDGEEIGDDDPLVVDFYVRRGRGLRLHELACLALCRALDLAPFLTKYVLSYFEFSAPPFKRWSLMGPDSEFTEKDINHLLCAIRVSYRFLLMEPILFSESWDWSYFLELVQNIANVDLGDRSSISSSMLDIRWCGIQILSVVLKISDRATSNFDIGMDEAFLCSLRWESFCQDTSVEKASCYFQETEMDEGSCINGTANFDYCLDSFLHDSSTTTCLNTDETESESRKLRKEVSCLSRNNFIQTSTLEKSLEMVIMAVSQKWPVLLHGPTGAGKTALINYLAQRSRNQVLFIHMDEQADSKTLIGTYICTEKPGEFKWQPGSLTQAILEGFWVVFEDIDKAPKEVHSIILPLLEGSSSFGTGHGEMINVTESFRLFATVSTLKHENSNNTEGRLFFSALWRKVTVRSPSREDLLNIVNKLFPELQTFSTRLIDTFETVNSLAHGQISGFSKFSLRDLLKWCKRVKNLGFNLPGLELTNVYCQNIYQEAVDIFAASASSSDEKRKNIMKEIAKTWGVVPPEPESLFSPSKPVIQSLKSDLRIGRIILPLPQREVSPYKKPFIGIRTALLALERIACSVNQKEPVLLVGETGTGKTTLVQSLAMRLGKSLTVLNLSQQSDVTDLIGGFKPTDERSICMPLYQEFKALFYKSFSGKENEDLLSRYETYAMKKEWKKLLRKLLKACQVSVDLVQKRIGKMGKSESGSKRKRPLPEEILDKWKSFSSRLHNVRNQIDGSAGMSFKFVEGAFVSALKRGHWILLDEVNLAPPETLNRIVGVLDGENGSLCLTERGDVHHVDRHPNFRLFACMNPATDAGKRELPFSFRNRFTEYFIDDVLDDEDLTLFVTQFMCEIKNIREILGRIVQFYKLAKMESDKRLQDGANQKPQFSLRSLARALEYTRKATKDFEFQKALYDGFCMFFVTSLDGPSAKIMTREIELNLLCGCKPPDVPFDVYLRKSELQHESGSDAFIENYVLTRSVKNHLTNLARAVYIKRYPVLLQGPTSSGKTSLVHYLAAITGHKFVRINNHEHTDLQEYFGSYVTDSHGRLMFQEGVLVNAVRKGHWIVLDELNLAPSDVLEALNRLLDDNRELFVPELQETVSAHPDFMLFATQNPPTHYGGRKMLSRAFRNRFLELHVDEIPENELTTILEKRCRIPESHAKKMVKVMNDLQMHRQKSKIFAGKHGFITPRDLFRWSNRFRTFGKSYQDLAKDGYLLLAERLREENEKTVVKETFEKTVVRELKMGDLYEEDSREGDAVFKFARHPGFQNIIWTKSMQRLHFLVKRCFKLREPVLLVGETGGGKTSVCQLLSAELNIPLHILNCHQYTETSDFLGGYRPLREKSKLAVEFKICIENLKLSKIFLHFPRDVVLPSDISKATYALDQLNRFEPKNLSQQDSDGFEHVKLELKRLHQKWQTIFLWQDGPLVQAMKEGHMLLVDEISLADDSVLERLNSVLEPERKLSLAEKGGSDIETITAHPNFFVLATMNPGGDYGKKELSPALRNRFTEIWVPPVSETDELRHIAIKSFKKPELINFADPMLRFWQWFNQLQTGRILTLRDLLSWISFMNEMQDRLGPTYAFIHGAFLVVLDGLSLGTGLSKTEAKKLRESSLSFLLVELQKVAESDIDASELSKLENYGWGDVVKHADFLFSNGDHSQQLFGINPFYFSRGPNECKETGFEFLAPTTCRNALRVLRAMQVRKPVLLEGSPGVGKTSLVVALARYSGHSVVRINLSEQTEMMDLLGSDLPFEGDNGIEFCWSDGILLQAMKYGCWVLLDELNLAPQSVLEGLNSILDHRADIFIPELGQTFKCPDSFRVFACQNPSGQGGGRKGLPKSFLNRFTKVYVDELSAEDYLSICQLRHPSIPKELLLNLISFNHRLYEDTMILHKYGQEGSPWEFNLRDVIRSCQIIEGAPDESKPVSFLSTVYLQRMRTTDDRKEVLKLYESIFGVTPFISQYPQLFVSPQYLIVGSGCVGRNHFQPMKTLKGQLSMLPGIFHCLEASVHCAQQRWLCILVGPYSSGKTSLIRLLAQLTGNALNELNLSSETDVSELIGCFEQYNLYRSYQSIISQAERYVGEYFSLRVELSSEEQISARNNLFSKWSAFLTTKSSGPDKLTSAFEMSNTRRLSNSLEPLIEILEQLKHNLEKFKLPVPWSFTDLNKSIKAVLDLQKNTTSQPSAKFEWVSSDLIRAVECGEWVVLDNANVCNPTVLDRINSLVEPEASITINECGIVDGKPVMLHAHPNFRLFLTVDPKHGEVSRAMRNRGVEIYMMQPDWLPIDEGYRVCQDSKELVAIDAKQDEISKHMLSREATIFFVEQNCILKGERHHVYMDIEVNDVNRFLILSGIPIIKLVVAMSHAHMNAKAAGIRLGVRISLLELNRWVQLFQLLVRCGNQPIWSVRLSWEHTYLSLLGEYEGSDTVIQELSNSELYNLDSLSGFSLALPGGWPAPQSLRNFISYSKEACLRNTCMYLEFLGAQCASYEFWRQNKNFPLNWSKIILPSVIPKNVLHNFLFPNALDKRNLQSSEFAEFDLALANKMLLIAANWTIEQSTESDLPLYIQWFQWYNTQMQPYCSFFKIFLEILEQERDHPIWKCILKCRKEMLSYCEIDVDVRPIPLFSSKLGEMALSVGSLEKCKELLCNAINCVNLLHLTFQQWYAEKDHAFSLFKALGFLEKEMLNVIVESQEHSRLYTNLIEDHILFWKLAQLSKDRKSINSQHLDYMSITWRRIRKVAMKLQPEFPEAVHKLLEQDLDLNNTVASKLHYEKSVLWVHGGHPFLSSSAFIFHKVQQLLSFCDSIWPKSWLLKQTCGDNDIALCASISANADLRQLAMQGVCMASYIISKGEQDEADILHQLEEIYQKLSRRSEYEKRNLGIYFGSKTKSDSFSLGHSTSTCAFSPDTLLRQSSFGSWVITIPLSDKTSFTLDIKLLQELSRCTSIDVTKAYQAVSNTSDLLRHALDYSLNFSSRSPVDFSPHQSILWLLDAWNSVDLVQVKIASFVLEMWFTWHSSMWSLCSTTLKKFSRGDYDEFCHLVPLTRTATLDKIFLGSFSIKDYSVHCLKLRVASRNLWQNVRCCLTGDLGSSAHSLLKQIIFVHERSFQKNIFEEVMLILCQLLEKGFKPELLQILRQHISSSSNHLLISQLDLITKVIESLVVEPGITCPSYASLYNLGCAWFYIGVLRFRLLLNQDGPDPAMKYALKHSQIQERISVLKLEIKVRKECNILAGRSSICDDQKQRISLLQNLEKERKRTKGKVIYRPEPPKYKNLRLLCANFLEFGSCMELVKNLGSNKYLPEMIDEACNWQVTSASFISRLAEEYAEYVDIIRPIQVAVYEMKLGLSIALSSALERDYLRKKKVEEVDLDKISVIIYSLMQFPRTLPDRSNPIDLNIKYPKHVASDSIHPVDINLLEKLITVSSESPLEKRVSLSVHHINLIQTAHYICCSLLMDKDIFLFLEKTFGNFAKSWLDMKIKAKDDSEDKYYEFRPRSIKIEDIFEGNLCPLSKLNPDGSVISDCEETMMEEEFTAMSMRSKTVGPVDNNQDLIPESMLKSIVFTHNQLFGSSDLVKHPGICHISDEEKVCSFVDSYKLGMRILNDDLFFWLPFSTLDDCLSPEHLLYTCLEAKETLDLPYQQTRACNIYKESMASETLKMVKPLAVIQERVGSLLDEWPDHPSLQKILDLIDMLLAMPHCTPLSKALFGLQVLVSKVQFLQEGSSRFSLTDQLQPIHKLVYSWQKWGVDCWPALLDGVQQQYEINTADLWYPLLLLLHSSKIDEVIQSIEKFIQTSCIGEFKTRLHLLLAFHGQLNRGICLEVYSSHMKENLNILYNAFGYYIQFLPLVLEHITVGRRNIEKELEECQKLFHWGLHDSYSSIDNFRRTRQKIWKLIQKFNEILQQPFMVILNQDLKRAVVPAWLDQKVYVDKNMEALQFPLDLVQLSNTERFLWYDDWRNRANTALQSMYFSSASGVDVGHSEGFATVIKKLPSTGPICESFRKEWAEQWTSIEKICRNAAEFAHVWTHGTKNLLKRRALGELLEILGRCGLSKHRSELDLESSQASSLFLQPSYDVVHLLQQNSCTPRDTKKPIEENCASKWETANQYYFKNLAMLKQIEEVRQGFSKDLSLEQVKRATSFLYHLISIQQDQRNIVYHASEQLKRLRQLLNRIGIDDGYSIASNQHATLKCMWQQKQLLDSLLSMSRDVCLYLGIVKDSHLSTCDSIRVEVDSILVLINKFEPIFKKSKETLDKYLLGCDGDVLTLVSYAPFVVSEEMNGIVMLNFKTINDFEVNIKTLLSVKGFMVSVKDTLLNRFELLMMKGKEIKKDFESETLAIEQSISEEDLFFVEMKELVIDMYKTLDKLNKGLSYIGELSAKGISSNNFFVSYLEELHLDHLYDDLIKAVCSANKLVNCTANRKTEVEMYLKQFQRLLDLILIFGENIMLEFLDVHKTMAEMTFVLSQLFALLFSKGFGTAEDAIENTTSNRPQDANGTGMGEGEGVEDVSNQLEDESQLNGTSEKQEERDGSDRLQNKEDEGIEMDDDFAGDTLSVSEDSGQEDVEDDEEKTDLESKMGDTADGSQVADEKLWDKDKDDNLNNSVEKYDSGPSVQETDTSCRELRAKEDNELTPEESAEGGTDESDMLSNEEVKHDPVDAAAADDDDDNTSDRMDKVDAYEDQTEIQLDEQESSPDDVSNDEPQGDDVPEEAESCPAEEDKDESNISDHMGDENNMQVDENIENEGEHAADSGVDRDSNKETLESSQMDSFECPAQGDSFEPVSDTNKMNPEMHVSNHSDMSNGIAPSQSHDEVPIKDISMLDAKNGSQLAPDQLQPDASRGEESSLQRTMTNPYRNIGDAMEEWKEKVNVSDDPQEHEQQSSDILDMDVDEYRYTSEIEKGSSQALGAATSDQIKNTAEGYKSSEDEHIRKKVGVDRMDHVNEKSETCPLNSRQALTAEHKVDEELPDAAVSDDLFVKDIEWGDQNRSSGDMTSFESSYMKENVLHIDTLESDKRLVKSMHVEDNSDDMKQKSKSNWRKYELTTTRLSQELAEQLRLVLEPTLASKLQGDYRTGKRINMKKVIPYIASHFRKDKIWLRRTRPNKRDYQVVIAVDDSRSMSENLCGNVAIETLVTVCRAMSQLEVGQFAVASFGEKGNIKLLHDFDQTLTGEVGDKMISSLSFEKDNTLSDEPVVNMLTDMNAMLDTAVARARTPSGQNPLHQLILVISDGRFHEKENLRRCVRDILNRRRMIALVILDNPEESILDRMEAIYNPTLSFKKHLDSFPFPFYTILQNIEALPGTLADLLRQWFELMRNMSE